MTCFTKRDTTSWFATDGLWAWVVCFASFIIQSITIGSTYSFGIIFVEFLDAFHRDESVISWIGSLQSWLLYFTGFAAGPLAVSFSWRAVTICGALISCAGFMLSALSPTLWVLFLTYGILTGSGNGLMYTTSMVVVQHYFEKQRAMATGLAAAGSGVGMMVFGAIQSILIQTYSWKCSVLVIGGICGVLGVTCGCLLVPVHTSDSNAYTNCEKNEQTALCDRHHMRSYDDVDNQEMTISLDKIMEKTTENCCKSSKFLNRIFGINLFDLSLFKNPIFLLYILSGLTFIIGYFVSFTFTPERALTLGLTKTESGSLISIMGFANVASRIVFGWIAEKGSQFRFYMMCIVLCGKGALSVMIIVLNTYMTLVAYASLFGVFTGCFASLFPIFCVDHFGIENVERSLGQSLAFWSLGFLFGPPIGGWIVRFTGTTDALFISVAIIELFGGFLFFTIKLFFPKYGYRSMN